MTITRSQVERVLIKRAGQFMREVDMDYTTIDGTNEDLADVIGAAVRQSGHTVADLLTVSDGDLSAIDADDIDEVLDRAELRLLETIEGNLTLVTTTAADTSYSFSDLATRLDKRLVRIRARVVELYGAGAEIGTGVLIIASRHSEDSE